MLSPLRYPGSKVHLVDYFEAFMRENLAYGADLVESHAGGASLSLGLLEREVVGRVVLVERDPLVYSFWKAVKEQPEQLCAEIERVEISIDSWKYFHSLLDIKRPSDRTVVELGLACLFLNRTNFSGIISAGPIGGISQRSQYAVGCRFNRMTIVRAIEEIARYRKRIRVVFSDAVAYLRRNRQSLVKRGTVVYVDPPYFQQGRKLYRCHYNEKDHRSLARFLDASTFSWVVSYDNHPFIRGLFKNQKVVPIRLNYVVKQSRRAQEMLISNRRLLPVAYTPSQRIGKRATR